MGRHEFGGAEGICDGTDEWPWSFLLYPSFPQSCILNIICLDRDYDPALFEDAFPINDVVNLYSDNQAVDSWNKNVTSQLRGKVVTEGH